MKTKHTALRFEVLDITRIQCVDTVYDLKTKSIQAYNDRSSVKKYFEWLDPTRAKQMKQLDAIEVIDRLNTLEIKQKVNK